MQNPAKNAEKFDVLPMVGSVRCTVVVKALNQMEKTKWKAGAFNYLQHPTVADARESGAKVIQHKNWPALVRE